MLDAFAKETMHLTGSRAISVLTLSVSEAGGKNKICKKSYDNNKVANKCVKTQPSQGPTQSTYHCNHLSITHTCEQLAACPALLVLQAPGPVAAAPGDGM